MSTLVHKYINLKEPEDIKKQVSTKFLKKEITGFTLNLKPQRRSEQKVFFKFSPLFVVLTFQTIHQQPRSRSMRGKLTWLNLWNLLTINFSLDDLIISPHVKHASPYKFAPPPKKKNFFPTCTALISKKFPHTLYGDRRHYALSSNLFPFLKVHP